MVVVVVVVENIAEADAFLRSGVEERIPFLMIVRKAIFL